MISTYTQAEAEAERLLAGRHPMFWVAHISYDKVSNTYSVTLHKTEAGRRYSK